VIRTEDKELNQRLISTVEYLVSKKHSSFLGYELKESVEYIMGNNLVKTNIHLWRIPRKYHFGIHYLLKHFPQFFHKENISNNYQRWEILEDILKLVKKLKGGQLNEEFEFYQ